MNAPRFCDYCGATLDAYGRCPNGHPQPDEGTAPAPPPPPAPVYTPTPPPPPATKADKMAIASFVSALLGVLLYWCVGTVAGLVTFWAGGIGGCCTSPIAVIAFIAAVVCGFMGLKAPRFKWMAWVGLIVSALHILLLIVGLIMLVALGGFAALMEAVESGSTYPTY